MSVFVSAEELNARIETGQRQTILASLWEGKENRAWSKFQSEHIPTALFCDPASQLTGMPSRQQGRNPVPSLEVVTRAAKSWGIAAGRPTYIYDTGNGLFLSLIHI